MKLYHLPPAGNRVQWSGAVDEAAVRGLFAPWEPTFFSSGTAGLAALLTVLRTRMPGRVEVVLAAYNCPDMISAVLHAGCVPRLVDMAAGTPWMDPAEVARATGPRTLAIIGVDLFGIPERHALLRESAQREGCALIQDSAQGFPKRAGDTTWVGDAVVVSFGRGKPVSLLGGGAVLCRDRSLAQALGEVAVAAAGEDEPHHGRRVKAYNLLRKPRLYWIPASMPSLHLGETRFEALEGIAPMSPWLKVRIPPAVSAYRARGSGAERQYSAMTFAKGVVDLARSCGLPGSAPLSRYPLLLPDAEARDRAWSELEWHGVSRFYGAALPEVAGLEELLGASRDEFPVARDFAARLLTLPTHDGVRQRDVAAIGRLLGGGQVTVVKPLRESAG
jgi:dTDP-4-amino-4,6-dideoxygalactose transaminase